MRPWRADLFLAAALLVPSTASGTMVRRLALEDLVRAADRIVVATVARVEQGRDAAGVPATFVTLRVSQTLKGRASQQLAIKQFGGTGLGAAGARIPGMPRYREGEEVVLFLHGESRAGFTSPVGLYQGKYQVVRRGPRAYVRAPASHPILSSLAAGRGRAAAGPAPRTVSVPLADFLAAIAAVAAEAGAQ